MDLYKNSFICLERLLTGPSFKYVSNIYYNLYSFIKLYFYFNMFKRDSNHYNINPVILLIISNQHIVIPRSNY